MGQKDISEKVLVDYNDVFADIINVCVYDGKEVIEANDLENTSVHAQYKAEDDKLHEEERDVVKYWKKENIALVLYGIENQVKVDRNMPFRMIGYDGASYRGQMLDKTKSIVPVVSFVLYFGTEERWNRYKSIKECIEVPRQLDNYVNDYKLNIIEVAWLTDDELKMFKSDFGIVANFFVQKRKNHDYKPDDPREIQHVDAVLKLLSVMTGDKEYETLLYRSQKDGEVRNMCEVAQRLIKEGKEKGMVEVLTGLVQDNLITIEEAAKRANMTIEEFQTELNK